MTKQLMRHTEAIMRGSAAAHAQLIEHLLREHARLSTRCEQLEGKHLELLELSEDLLSQRSGRELTRERAIMQERRKDDLLRKMGMLLPVLMAKLSGNALPAQLDPAMRELAKSLDAEQLDKLTAVLRPEQVIALTTVLERSAPPAQSNGARKPSNRRRAMDSLLVSSLVAGQRAENLGNAQRIGFGAQQEATILQLDVECEPSASEVVTLWIRGERATFNAPGMGVAPPIVEVEFGTGGTRAGLVGLDATPEGCQLSVPASSLHVRARARAGAGARLHNTAAACGTLTKTRTGQARQCGCRRLCV